MSERVVEGGCLCGAVRYRVGGAPISSGICHCRSCRRTSGSPTLPYVTFPIARVRDYPRQARGLSIVGAGDAQFLRSMRHPADVSSRGLPRSNRRDDLQPGRPGSVSTDAAHLDESQTELDLHRRRLARLRDGQNRLSTLTRVSPSTGVACHGGVGVEAALALIRL